MSDIQSRLRALAFAKTKPFCYHCYTEAPTGRCARCHSDDLMRLLPGVGPEWGIDWVIRELIDSADLTPVDVEERLAETVRDVYGETVKVGWLTLDTVDVLKEHESDWRMAVNEEECCLLNNDEAVTFDNGSTLYWTHDVESWLDDEELALETAEVVAGGVQ